jgi:hypothetical protein
MQLPNRLPALRWIIIIWGVYMIAWATLEGGLWATVLAAVLTATLLLGHLFNRILGGRMLSTTVWLLIMVVFGALFGFGSALLTLIFMAIKTGLHAHGPEFSAMELNWVFQQMPLWTFAGLLGGLGFGLILKAVSTQTD